MKKKMKYLLVMLAVLMGCFSFVPVRAQAHERENEVVEISQKHVDITIIARNDVPTEIKQPIEKGKSLFTYLIRVTGWMIAIFGFLFFAISFFSHQTDQRITGAIAFFIGLLVAFAPEITSWITGQ